MSLLEPTRRWTAFADVRRLQIYHIENTSSRLFESSKLDEAALFDEVKETIWEDILSECHDLNSLFDSIHAMACRASTCNFGERVLSIFLTKITAAVFDLMAAEGWEE